VLSRSPRVGKSTPGNGLRRFLPRGREYVMPGSSEIILRSRRGLVQVIGAKSFVGEHLAENGVSSLPSSPGRVPKGLRKRTYKPARHAFRRDIVCACDCADARDFLRDMRCSLNCSMRRPWRRHR